MNFTYTAGKLYVMTETVDGGFLVVCYTGSKELIRTQNFNHKKNAIEYFNNCVKDADGYDKE